MVEENLSQEFRFKNINGTRKYFLEEIKQNELMSKKHKMVCTTLKYIEHFCFFNWYSYRNYEFCNSTKTFFNNSSN